MPDFIELLAKIDEKAVGLANPAPAIVAGLDAPIPYPNAPAPDQTWVKYAQDLKTTYGVTKKYFSVEQPSQHLLRFLAATYETKSISYQDIIPTFKDRPDAIVMDQEVSSLVVMDPRLDAFYFCWNAEDKYNEKNRVILFFDDASQFTSLYVPPERRDYTVPMGNYELVQGMMGFEMIPLKVKANEKPIIDHDLMNCLTTDTEVFFSNREFYKANGLPHKRGLLLFGTPGVGKTVLSKHYLSKMTNVYGVMIDCGKISFGASLIEFLDHVCGTKPKLIVLEDVDGACNGYGGRSAFLNFLDGPKELDNTLVFATTNYPERLDSAILDRPSRFDAIYLLDLPGPDLRKEFLLRWFPDLVQEPERLDALAMATDGFSGAYFRELFVLKGLRKSTIEEALQAIHDRKKMIQKFNSVKRPDWGNDEPGEQLYPMEASLKAQKKLDFSIDRDLALKIVAGLRIRAGEDCSRCGETFFDWGCDCHKRMTDDQAAAYRADAPRRVAAWNAEIDKIDLNAGLKKKSKNNLTPARLYAAFIVSKSGIFIPPKIAKNVSGFSGTFADATSWQAKIVLANSAPAGTKKGAWDKVGYVLINPKTGQVVPVARADEHNTGFDLLYHYYGNGAIKSAEGFTAIYCSGNTYGRTKDAEFVEALKFWVANGGQDLTIYDYDSRRSARISTWLSGGPAKKNGTKLAEGGSEWIAALEAFSKAWLAATSKVPSEAEAKHVFDLAYKIRDIANTWSFYDGSPGKGIDIAFTDLDLQKLGDGILGPKGPKNTVHNDLREYIADPDKGVWREKYEDFFGNLELAKTELDRLGSIKSSQAYSAGAAPRKTKTFKTDEGQFSVHDVEKDPRGRADMFTVHHDPEGYVVRNVLIPEAMRRQGIATEFYNRTNSESLAKTGKPLRSTRPRTLSTGEAVHELSPEGIALWDSFVKKGLAEKKGDKDYVFKAGLFVAEDLSLPDVAPPGFTVSPAGWEVTKAQTWAYYKTMADTGDDRDAQDAAFEVGKALGLSNQEADQGVTAAIHNYDYVLTLVWRDEKRLAGAIAAHVRKRGNKWAVTNKAGDKTLGTHDTEADARKQLAAIEISKHVRGVKAGIKALETRLWIRPDGEVLNWDVENTDPHRTHHVDMLRDTEFPGDIKTAIENGWARVAAPRQGTGILFINCLKDVVESAVSKLSDLFPSAKSLIIDMPKCLSEEVEILEGEDALDAWRHRNDVRHRQPVKAALYKSVKFWMDPSGKYYEFSDKEHDMWLLTDSPERLGGFATPNAAAKAQKKALLDGWVRGGAGSGILTIELNSMERVDEVLKRLPAERLFVHSIIVDDISGGKSEIVDVGEGEDALDAWKHRNDVRHRQPVKAAIEIAKHVRVVKADIDNLVEIELGCANADTLGLKKAKERKAGWDRWNETHEEKIRIKDPEPDCWEGGYFYKEGSLFTTEGRVGPLVDELKAAGIDVDIVHKGLDQVKAAIEISKHVHGGIRQTGIRFWIAPDGEYKEWQSDTAEDPWDESGETSHSIKLFELFDNINLNSEDLDADELAVASGYTRGIYVKSELCLQVGAGKSVEWALSKIPVEYTFVKNFVVEGEEEIPVLEGEDALDAWKHRNDVRHRQTVTAAFNQVKYWVAPDGKVFDASPSHFGWIDDHHDLWKKYDKDSKLAQALEVIDDTEDEQDINEQRFYQNEFVLNGWTVVDGDSISTTSEKLKIAKDFVKDYWLGDDREKKIEVEFLDGGFFSGKVKDFMQTKPAEIKAANSQKFNALYRAANALAAADPKWAGSLGDAVAAQAFGAFQRAVKDSRSEDELQQAWEAAGPQTPWEAVLAEAADKESEG